MMISYNKQEIIDKFISEGTGNIINDHRPEQMDKIDALVEFQDKDMELAEYILDNMYFSLNKIYLCDNELHISTCSIAGTVVNTGDIQDDIIKYNESVFSTGKRIKRLYFPNGTVYDAL